MGFFITEEKELPEFSNTDANKVLKVDPSGVYLQWLQETTAPAELPPVIPNGFLRTNNSAVQWQAFTASTSNFLRADGAFSNVRQVPAGGTAGWMLRTTGTGSEWNGNLVTSATNTTLTQPLLAPDGSTSAPSYSFTNSTTTGLVRTLVGADIGIGFVAAGTQVCSIVGGNMRLSGGSLLRNNVSNPSANIQFIGSTGGATGNISMSFVDNHSDVVNTATYRLGNGDNFQATETVMSRLRGLTLTSEIFATEHGNTYFRFLGATGTGSTALPARVQRVEINNSGMIISGTLDLGSIGTAANPSLTFGDTLPNRSGIFSTADNSLAISTNGVQRFEVNDNGVNSSTRFIASRGTAITNGYSFNGTDISGMYASNTDRTMHLISNSVIVLSVLNTGGTGGTGGTSTTTVNGNLVMTGSTGGIGVVASTADAAGLYSTTNTTTGIRFNNTNNNLRLLCNQQNIIDCTRNSNNNEGLASIEEVLQIKKCVRTPMLEINADFTMAVLTPKFLRVDIANGNQLINLGVMPVRCEGQYHTILPFKSSVNGNRLYITTAGSTAAEIHYYENRVKTVITGNTQFEIFEGVVYQCIYKSISGSTGIWYFWPDCNSASQGVVTVTGIQFGGAGSYITGTSAGVSSTMSMQLNSTTAMSTTQDDFSIFNTLKLSKAPTADFHIVDFDNYAITRDTPPRIILTRRPSGTGTTQITFPNPNTVPGLEIEVIVWNLPNKNGTGKKRVRFTEVSAFVIGASNLNMMAEHSTNYEVAEGTWFTANCIRISNNNPTQTVNRWFLRARQWVVPSGGNALEILPNADT